MFWTDAANVRHNHARGRPRTDAVNAILRNLARHIGGSRVVVEWHRRGGPSAKRADLLSRGRCQDFLASGPATTFRRSFTPDSTLAGLADSLRAPLR